MRSENKEGVQDPNDNALILGGNSLSVDERSPVETAVNEIIRQIETWLDKSRHIPKGMSPQVCEMARNHLRSMLKALESTDPDEEDSWMYVQSRYICLLIGSNPLVPGEVKASARVKFMAMYMSCVEATQAEFIDTFKHAKTSDIYTLSLFTKMWLNRSILLESPVPGVLEVNANPPSNELYLDRSIGE